MRVNGIQLNSLQANFIKDLMGDVFMTDTRAEAIFAKACAKHGVDAEAVLEGVNKNFAIKNEEFKRLEAEELAAGK